MSAPTSIPGVQPPSPLLAQCYTLQAAIALGARVVRFQDRTVEYQSVDDMIKAANYLYLQLASTGGIPGVNGVTRQIRMYTNKGL
jgi:hypothetical protein